MNHEERSERAAAFADLEVLAKVLDAAPDGMLVVDRQGVVRMWNGEARKLFGYPADAALGQPVETLIPGRFGARHRQHRLRYANAPRRRPMGTGMELLARLRDGSEVPVEVSLSPVEIGGEPCVIASIRDIGPRRRAEENQRRLQQQEALIALWELALRKTSATDACRSAVEYLGSTLGARRVRLFETEAGSDPGRHQVICDTAPEAGDNAEITEWPGFSAKQLGERARSGHLPSMFAHGDTTIFDLKLQALDLCGGMLEVRMPEGTRLDTDQSYLVHSIAHLLATALASRQSNRMFVDTAKLEALGQLSGGIAHDFNNLLSVVSGNLELLEDQLRDRDGKAAALRMLDSTRRAVRRGSQLTQRLLLFARKQEPDIAPHRLQDNLPGLAEMLPRLLGEGIDLQLAIPANLPAVMLDPGILDACVINLATNARDAMTGGGTLRIDARVSRTRRPPAPVSPGRYVVLAVADTGTGMPEDVLRRAFDPFFTTKGSGHGTGLGLSMIRSLMQQLGGEIVLDSQPHRGTEAHLYFRVAEAADVVAEPAPAVPPGGNERVLVVEDDAVLRATTQALVAQLGYRTLVCDSMPAALKLLDANDDVALLFTDVALGRDGSGLDLAREARSGHPELPVLLTSGYVRDVLEQDRALARQLPLLVKPYTREQLAQALQEALAGAPPRR